MAAAWIAALRREVRDEVEGNDAGLRALCPGCTGANPPHRSPTCGTCDGAGWVRKPSPAFPAECAGVLEIVEAFGFVETHGLGEFRALYGKPSQELIEGYGIIAGELAMIEAKERAEERRAHQHRAHEAKHASKR